MDILSVLRDLAIIVIVAKAFGLLARKLKAPQVVGEIVAGLLIGPSVLNIVKLRSEERRVGKECRSRWSPYH